MPFISSTGLNGTDGGTNEPGGSLGVYSGEADGTSKSGNLTIDAGNGGGITFESKNNLTVQQHEFVYTWSTSLPSVDDVLAVETLAGSQVGLGWVSQASPPVPDYYFGTSTVVSDFPVGTNLNFNVGVIQKGITMNGANLVVLQPNKKYVFYIHVNANNVDSSFTIAVEQG
ncbi:MAG: hypothetical protein K0U20_09795, partial [Proteobacteria bacterium]|nr:hypothetical protein [Pseudomonadota bacterium]